MKLKNRIHNNITEQMKLALSIKKVVNGDNYDPEAIQDLAVELADLIILENKQENDNG